MKIKAAIFDMDGVIFNTENLWQDAFVIANHRYNLPLVEQDRQRICGKTERVIRQELHDAYPKLDVDAYRNSMLTYVQKEIADGHFEIKEGFLNLIKDLQCLGIRTGLATSAHRDRAFCMFDHKGLSLEDIFTVAVFSEDVGARSKPDPYIFDLAAKKMGVDNSDCCVIEDSNNGIVAAKRGGFFPIMVVDLIEPDEFCLNNAHIVRNLMSIRDLL